MHDLATARHDVRTLRPQLPGLRRERDRLQGAWDVLVVRLAEAHDDVRATERELDATHDRLAQLAADAYTQGTPGRVTAVVDSFSSADDLVDASRDMVLIDQYGVHQEDVARAYEARKRALARRVRAMNDQRAALRERLDASIAAFDSTASALAGAHARLEEARSGIAQFHALAVNSASPILGPNRLTADDLAAFVRAHGPVPQLSVSIEELARIYIEESEDEGLRGDVAWAQSILETGWFGFTGSMVERPDNNFAGIGACDSCSRGLVFPDARTGVRAQVQGLKIYVDADYGTDTAAHPIIRPGMLKLGFRGDVHSWWDLTGRWATARNYGPRVYDLYLQMVAFAEAR